MELPQRYNRQLGLVYQEKIEDLDVLITGVNSVLPYLLTELAFLGVGTSQGGIYVPDDGSVITSQNLNGQLLFDRTDLNTSVFEAVERTIFQINDDINVFKIDNLDSLYFDSVVALPYQDGEKPPFPKRQKIIWGQVSNLGMYMGGTKVEASKFTSNILTPSLSALCAGLISQEILRVNDCIRPSDITKTWVTVNYLFRRPDAYASFKKAPAKFRKFITNEDLAAHLEKPEGETSGSLDAAIYRVELPRGSRLHEYVIDSIDVLEKAPLEIRRPIDELYLSPIDGCCLHNGVIEEPDLSLPMKVANKKLMVFGVGGLGSWLSCLLAVTNLENVDLVVVDEDRIIEEHNLNRQILFEPEHIGSPKTIAARKRLESLNSSLKVRGYIGSLSLDTVKCHVAGETVSPKEFNDKWGENLPEDTDPFVQMNRKSDLDRTLAYEAGKTDAVIACLDSLFGRYVASALAHSCEATLVNAGSQHFEGNTDLIPYGSGCMVCWHGERVKYDTERVRCGELEAPTLSIVTTTSITASLQTALLISNLLSIGTQKHYTHYRGKINSLSTCQLGQSTCPMHSKKEDCPGHLNWKGELPNGGTFEYKLF